MSRRGSFGRIALALLLPACNYVFDLDRHVDAPPVVPAKWTVVTAGAEHTCGLQDTGALFCWGRNGNGQLGLGTSVDEIVPTRVGADTWRAVSAGLDSTCAIKTDGSLWCWGNNDSGQLGIGNRIQNETPIRVGTATTWRSIAAGSIHSCAIREDDSLWCWGSDTFGAVGNSGVNASTQSPEQIEPAFGWTAVATSIDHTCAITTGDGALYCWGAQDDDQLGYSAAAIVQTPMRAGTDGGWTQITTRGDNDNTHACGVRGDGAYCWGANRAGQASTALSGTVTPTATEQPLTSISAGGEHTCGITADGALYCWGRNERGELAIGDPSGTDHHSAQRVPGTWASVSAGTSHTCAIDIDGNLHCAGTNAHGELGDNTGGPRSAPVRIGAGYTQIALGTTHACALGATGIDCWGSNRQGQLAMMPRAPRNQPASSGTFAGATQIAAGDDQTCVLAGTTVRCWGGDGGGSLGNGAAPGTFTPTVVTHPSSKPWQAITAGQHGCALDNDPNASGWCWGDNQFGELGDNSRNSRQSPVALASSGIFTQVAASANHTCGLRNFIAIGEVWCWGTNVAGQIGDGTIGAMVVRPLPTSTRTDGATSPALQATRVAVGANHTCAITPSDSLYCWGSNGRSQLGDGSVETRTAPRQIADGYIDVAAGGRHTCGITTAKTLSCWGDNSVGQLGDGTFSLKTRPSPVSAPPLQWRAVAARDDYTCALSVDDELYCWGLNHFGRLGDGSAWRPSFAPVATR